MIVKINDKEYSFDGYAQPLQSVQQLADECYQQGIADLLMPYDVESIEELIENVKSKARADAFSEVYDRIDAGVCEFCELKDIDNRCYKNCTMEIELIKKWLKEQNN